MNTQTQEALKMAIEAFNLMLDDYAFDNCDTDAIDKAIQFCKEALAQPAQKSYEQSWYDTHPTPSWQGLSDDEIYKCQHPEYPDTMYFARAIEQALKEKNA